MVTGGWWREAACVGQPLELFFPPKGGTSRPGKEICKPCPVRGECLSEILKMELPGDRYGVFGGLSAKDREKKFDGRTHRSLPRTHCNQGHEFTDDNILTFGGRRRCKTCHENDPRLMANRTHCRYEHELTADNLYTQDGRLLCRQCNKDKCREYKEGAS